MKFLYITLALVGFLSSCKVNAPLDPLTMKPSCKYCPKDHFYNYPTSCSGCNAQSHTSSK